MDSFERCQCDLVLDTVVHGKPIKNYIVVYDRSDRLRTQRELQRFGLSAACPVVGQVNSK